MKMDKVTARFLSSEDMCEGIFVPPSAVGSKTSSISTEEFEKVGLFFENFFSPKEKISVLNNVQHIFSYRMIYFFSFSLAALSR